MKYIHVLPFLLVVIFCTSCGQGGTNPPKDNAATGAKDTVSAYRSNDPKIHTQYEYTDAAGKRLVVQNSFPKAGPRYKDPNGKEYVYAVFWTRIINETADTLKTNIDFPTDSFELAPSSGIYMKLLLPSDMLTIDKEPLFDYGLNIKSFLDKHRYQSSSLKRTIDPGDSSAFYVVLLSNRGVDGVLRPGLSVREGALFYTISSYKPSAQRPPTFSLTNKKELPCGSINLKLFTVSNGSGN